MSNANKTVEIELDHFHHQPFQQLTGKVRVLAETASQAMELRIFWFTQGRGDEEVGIEHRQKVTPQQGLAHFSFQLPAHPYSFAGQLITLAWAVEVVDEKENSLDLVPFLLSPTGEEMQLEVVPDNTRTGRLKQKLEEKFAARSQR